MKYRYQNTDKSPPLSKGCKRGYSRAIALSIVFAFTLLFFVNTASAAKWSGVDESVVEKYAEEHGRAPRDPIINTDQGDLLLFVFLLGGIVGGFAAGYYWRVLTEQKNTTQYAKPLNKVQHGSNNGSK